MQNNNQLSGFFTTQLRYVTSGNVRVPEFNLAGRHVPIKLCVRKGSDVGSQIKFIPSKIFSLKTFVVKKNIFLLKRSFNVPTHPYWKNIDIDDNLFPYINKKSL